MTTKQEYEKTLSRLAIIFKADMIKKLSEQLGLPVEALIQPYEPYGRQETAEP